MIDMTPSPHRRAGTSRRGFTLIELVVVLVLAAILAGVAVPSMAGLAGTRAKAAARLISHDLGYARERALATGITVWVSFNASTETYTMLEESLSTPGRVSATAMTDPATGRAFSQSFAGGELAGVDIASVAIGGGTANEVGFDWLGRPKDQAQVLLTSTGTITLSSGNSVTVQADTGLAKALP